MKKPRIPIPANRRKEIKAEMGNLCEICKGGPYFGRDLHIHHADRDATNNERSNLQVLCSHCHYRVHQNDRWDSLHQCWDSPHVRANRRFDEVWPTLPKVTVTVEVAQETFDQWQRSTAYSHETNLGKHLSHSTFYLGFWSEAKKEIDDEVTSDAAGQAA